MEAQEGVPGRVHVMGLVEQLEVDVVPSMAVEAVVRVAQVPKLEEVEERVEAQVRKKVFVKIPAEVEVSCLLVVEGPSRMPTRQGEGQSLLGWDVTLLLKA